MLRKLIYILLPLASLLTEAAHAESVKAALDSSQITMGYQTAIRFDIVAKKDAPADILFDQRQVPPEIEFVDWVGGDTTDLGNGLVEIKRALLIQSFDSGVYTIPEFILVAGRDTLRTQPLTLKVNPVDVSKMDDINPIAPAMKFETRWYDYLPDWLTEYWQLWLAGILIIAAGACAYLILSRKVPVTFLPQPKPISPYDLAMQRLMTIRDSKLWQAGQEKEYYTMLIDTLRDYLQGRFGINAMEMTSQQIIDTLQGNDETRMSNQRMKQILQTADFVKFAKVRPLPDDNFRALQEAIQFVEDTKPKPPMPEGFNPQAPNAG